MTQQIQSVNVSLARRYDEVIRNLQNIITEARAILNEVENKNMTLGSNTNNFISSMEKVTSKSISAFNVITEARNQLYNIE